MTQKQIILTIVSLFLISMIAGSAQAVFSACFERGDVINFCNPAIPDKIVDVTTLVFCMTSYDSEQDCYVHASFNACNGLPSGSGSCTHPSPGENNTPQDTTPPVITFTNPKMDNTSLFSSTSVKLAYHLNEKADVFYSDLTDSNRRESKICDDCRGDKTKSVRFKEGLNKIRFRTVDMYRNTRILDIQFFIDTKNPKIREVLPARGFADGSFSATIDEANPRTINLHYGNANKGFKRSLLNVNTDCQLERKSLSCSKNVNLSDYNGQSIQYWFEVIDIASKQALSKKIVLSVDTQDPLINFIQTTISGKSATLRINVMEPNLESIEYSDNGRRPKLLCNKLISNVCEKKIVFSTGSHTVFIQVTDKAGNAVGQSVSFVI